MLFLRLCLYHVTIILHCHWCEFWSIISIKNEKLLNSNNKRIRANPSFSGSSGISSHLDWLRIYWIWSVQYLKSTWDKALIGIGQLLKWSGFSLPPISFSYKVPLRVKSWGAPSPQSTLDKNSLIGIGLNLTFSKKLGFDD